MADARMGFEFDRAKSDSNRAKHGIDFVDVQALWADPDLRPASAAQGDQAL